MAYDEALAQRLRDLVGDREGVTEKNMFGGLAFLVGGHLAVAASGQGGLLVRADPARFEALTADPHARPLEMRGRPMRGWLRVDAEHVESGDALARWVELGTGYAGSLPAKPEAASTASTRRPRRRSARP